MKYSFWKTFTICCDILRVVSAKYTCVDWLVKPYIILRLLLNTDYRQRKKKNKSFLILQGESERSTTDLWKIIKINPDVLWLKYLYGSKAYYVFGVLWKNEIVWKSHFQDMSDWTQLP